MDEASYNVLKGMRKSIYEQYDFEDENSVRNITKLKFLDANNGIKFGSRKFALPPNMSPLHAMFETGDMAIVGNVGPLIEPTTRATMDDYSADIPRRLFSHNDQQSTWAALDVEGAQLGWGGKFADAALAANASSNPTFSSIATTSGEVFLSGRTVQPYVAPRGTVDPLEILNNARYLGGGGKGAQARAILEQQIASRGEDFDNLFKSDIAARNRRAFDNNKVYIDAVASSMEESLKFSDSSLSKQLSSVARTISIRHRLGVQRQIFHVSIGGFDTHNRQAATLPGLQAQIATALAEFKNAMVTLKVWDDVTVFTSSEFGRTAIGNEDGTDHGWGGHQFVLGGAVKGKNIYGDIPPLDLSDQQYTGMNGRMIPNVSVEQYAATLGSWFGLNETELSDALPNLNNFTEKNLRFMEDPI